MSANEQNTKTIAKALTKKGLTAAQIAEKVELPVNTVRNILKQLAGTGAATVIGSAKTGLRGRPSNIYAKVSA